MAVLASACKSEPRPPARFPSANAIQLPVAAYDPSVPPLPATPTTRIVPPTNIALPANIAAPTEVKRPLAPLPPQLVSGLAITLTLRDAERSDDSNWRVSTMTVRDGQLTSIASHGGGGPMRTPSRSAKPLSPADLQRIATTIAEQRLDKSESLELETTALGRSLEVALTIEQNGRRADFKLKGMTRLMGSTAPTPFTEHALSRRVSTLISTLSRIVAGL